MKINCAKETIVIKMKLPVFAALILIFTCNVCSGAQLRSKSIEKVNSITTKTSNCFQCGMIEGLGFLDIKVIKKQMCVMEISGEWTGPYACLDLPSILVDKVWLRIITTPLKNHYRIETLITGFVCTFS